MNLETRIFCYKGNIHLNDNDNIDRHVMYN